MTGIDLYSFRALWQHYRARRHKRNTFNALAFEIDAEANHLALERELRMHAYRPARSICFISEGPKPREVFAADFRDRVVHHLLVSQLEKLYEPRFIHDSYACRKGRGTLAASARLMVFLCRVLGIGPAKRLPMSRPQSSRSRVRISPFSPRTLTRRVP